MLCRVVDISDVQSGIRQLVDVMNRVLDIVRDWLMLRQDTWRLRRSEIKALQEGQDKL